jgi:hypothetical protein
LSGAIHRRDDTQAVIWTEPAPETDPTKGVRAMDAKLSFASGKIQIEVWSDVENSWILLGWLTLPGVPSEFQPVVHDWYGDRHSGDRPLKVIEHLPGERTHRQVKLDAWALSMAPIQVI